MKILLSLHKIYYFSACLRQDLPKKTPTDKSNAIKTVINFLSFVKPLKTGINYPPTPPNITKNTTTESFKGALTHNVLLDTYPHRIK